LLHQNATSREFSELSSISFTEKSLISVDNLRIRHCKELGFLFGLTVLGKSSSDAWEFSEMRHRDVWRALDKLAAQNDLTPSGLAKLAGLDPTAFNKSKRKSRDGRPRWPSTESVSLVLAAVGAGFDDFAQIIEGRRGDRAPLIGFAEAGADGYFDDAGFPVGEGWEEVRFPGLGDETVYALEISGDSMEPAYRAGDRIIVSPETEVRRGDRVVVKTTGGEVMAKVLGKKNTRRVELLSLNPRHKPREFSPKDISWIARILWASQ